MIYNFATINEFKKFISNLREGVEGVEKVFSLNNNSNI